MKRTLYHPIPEFTGKICGVDFSDGVGVCDSDFLAGFLCAKGFALAPDEPVFTELSTAEPVREPPVLPDTSELEEMPIDDLVKLAHELDVPLSGVRRGDKSGVIERLLAGGS